VLLRYAIRINGVTELALTKLDILSGFQNILICTGYRNNEHEITNLPYGPSDLSGFKPIYEELPGWQEDIRTARHWENLPPNARAYILRIEDLIGVQVRLVSVGPEREEFIEII
ncbi:MAG: adenylosuccinate synthetase, partial [Anaerolineales bacterium]